MLEECLPHVGIGVDADDAQRRIGAVPDDGFDLALPDIGLERPRILRAAPEQETRRREAVGFARGADEGVRPDRVESLDRREIDEFVEIAFPGATVVVEKQQSPAAVDQYPSCRQDGRNAAEFAPVEPEARQQVDREQNQPQQPPPQHAGLHRGHAGEMILEAVDAAFLARIFLCVLPRPAQQPGGTVELRFVLMLHRADRQHRQQADGVCGEDANDREEDEQEQKIDDGLDDPGHAADEACRQNGGDQQHADSRKDQHREPEEIERHPSQVFPRFIERLKLDGEVQRGREMPSDQKQQTDEDELHTDGGQFLEHAPEAVRALRRQCVGARNGSQQYRADDIGDEGKSGDDEQLQRKAPDQELVAHVPAHTLEQQFADTDHHPRQGQPAEQAKGRCLDHRHQFADPRKHRRHLVIDAAPDLIGGLQPRIDDPVERFRSMACGPADQSAEQAGQNHHGDNGGQRYAVAERHFPRQPHRLLGPVGCTGSANDVAYDVENGYRTAGNLFTGLASFGKEGGEVIADPAFTPDLGHRSSRTAAEEGVRADVMANEVFLDEFGRCDAGYRIAGTLAIDGVEPFRCDPQQVVQKIVARSVKGRLEYEARRNSIGGAENDEAAEVHARNLVKPEQRTAFQECVDLAQLRIGVVA